MPKPSHHYRRGGDGSSLSTSTIIIIAVVCGCVIILVFSLFLWRLILRTFKPRQSLPLPPVQELAHQREQQLALFSDQQRSSSAVWLDPGGIPARPYSRHLLLPAGSATSLSSSTKFSPYVVDDLATESSSQIPSPLSAEHLTAPNPPFREISPQSSIASLVSSAASSDAPTMSPSSSMAVSEQFASPNNSALPAIESPPRRLQSRSRSMSQSRSRPVSMASSITTMQSSQSRRSVLRGAPHGRYSTLQVVLPAPLAPELFPYEQAAAPGELIPGSRTSYLLGGLGAPDPRRRTVYADPWAAGSTSRLDERAQRRPLGTATSPLSQDRRSSSLAGRSEFARSPSSTPTRTLFRRTLSQSFIPDDRLSVAPPPPVPRIPSIYGNGLSADAPLRPLPPEREPERGRTRYSASVPPPALAPAAVALPPSASAESEEFPNRAKGIPPQSPGRDAEGAAQANRKRSHSKLRKSRQSSTQES